MKYELAKEKAMKALEWKYIKVNKSFIIEKCGEYAVAYGLDSRKKAEKIGWKTIETLENQ